MTDQTPGVNAAYSPAKAAHDPHTSGEADLRPASILGLAVVAILTGLGWAA